MATVEEITEADIEALRTAAGQAGDLAQVEICDRALRLIGRDVDAWEQCERVILSWRAEKRLGIRHVPRREAAVSALRCWGHWAGMEESEQEAAALDWIETHGLSSLPDDATRAHVREQFAEILTDGAHDSDGRLKP